MAHTPGPWACYMAKSASINPNQAAFVVGPKRLTMDKSLGFSLADACLIAAAPELLEALEAMMKCFDDGVGEQWNEKELDAARAAIAKAKGLNPDQG